MISASIRRKRHRYSKSRSSSPTTPSTASSPLPRRRPTRRCISLAPNYIEAGSSSSPAAQHQQTQESIDSAASFEVRAILDQRANQDGELEYLVDWEDSPRTGRAFSPSWEPIANICAPQKVAEFQSSAGVGHGTLNSSSREVDEDKATSSNNNTRIQRRRSIIHFESDISDSPQGQIDHQKSHHSLESSSPSAPNYPASTRTAPSRHAGFSRVSLSRDHHHDQIISIPFPNNSSSPASFAIGPPQNRPSLLPRKNSTERTTASPVKSRRNIIPESQPYQPNFYDPSPSIDFIASANSKDYSLDYTWASTNPSGLESNSTTHQTVSASVPETDPSRITTTNSSQFDVSVDSFLPDSAIVGNSSSPDIQGTSENSFHHSQRRESISSDPISSDTVETGYSSDPILSADAPISDLANSEYQQVTPSDRFSRQFSSKTISQEQSTGEAYRLIVSIEDISPTIPRPPLWLESSKLARPPRSQSHTSGYRSQEMPETRRSRGGPAPPAATDDTDSPVRKSLRGIRNEAAAKRAELKAKAQKLAEQKKLGSDASKTSAGPDSVGDSENGTPNGSSRRGRKPKTSATEEIPSSKVSATSDAQDDVDNRLTNGDEALNLDSELVPSQIPEELDGTATTDQIEQTAPIESKPRLSKMEFVVPIPLMPQAADQYYRTVTYNKVFIEQFTARSGPKPEMVTEAESFIQKMRDICLHIDLVNDSIEDPSDVTADIRALWDRSISSKFKFLYHLLVNLRDQELHLAILGKPRVLDLVEKFIAGNDITYERLDNGVSGRTTKDYQLTVSILPSENVASSESESRPADVILSLDNTLDVSNPAVRSFREKSGSLIPIMFLAVLNSVDHVDRSISSTISGVDRLQTEIACLTKLRQEAGRLSSDYQNVEEAASLVALFLAHPEKTDADWAVADLGPLDDNEAWDLAMGNTVLLQTSSSQEPRQKRSRETSTEKSEEPANKKTRIDGEAEIGEGDDSKITDSVIATQPPLPSQQEWDNKFAAQKVVEDELKAKIREKEASLKDRDSRLRTLENDFDMQMNRFEEQSRKLLETQGLLQKAIKDLEDAGERRTRREEFITKLKDENKQLKDDLQAARLALESSAIPEIAELERLRREKAEAETAKQKAVKELANERDVSGYLRTEYMNASNSAAEMRSSNDYLQSKVSGLEVKANGEAARLKQLGMDNQTKAAFRELDRLKAELKTRDALLARKEEEIKVKRSGISTRAGSVPRSPRVGPTNSRAASPIPDRRIENLKNNNFPPRKPKSVPSDERPPRATMTVTRDKEPTSKPAPSPKVSQESKRPKSPSVKQLPDLQPARGPTTPTLPSPSTPVIELKSGPPTSRPFPCCFAQYNCTASFTSKNEWKRHISTKHIQLGFWRCDMCTPSPGLDHPVYNDFNRKDLFTQHLRRMHSPAQQEAARTGQPIVATVPLPDMVAGMQLSDDEIAAIQKRCYRILRNPPPQSSCLFCTRIFTGPNSWDERLEHVGGHLERDRKNGTGSGDIANWKEDLELRNYLLKEGIVERDVRAGWRIGDGRPRRSGAPAPLPDSESPTQQQGSPIPGADGDSESSMSKRRRGRPPKRYADVESPVRLAPSSAARQSERQERPIGPDLQPERQERQALVESAPSTPQPLLSLGQEAHQQVRSIQQPPMHDIRMAGPPMIQPRVPQPMEHHHQQPPLTPNRLEAYGNALQIQQGFPQQGPPHPQAPPHSPMTPLTPQQHQQQVEMSQTGQQSAGRPLLPHLMPRTPQNPPPATQSQPLTPQPPTQLSPFGPPQHGSQMQLPPPQSQASGPGLVHIAPAPPMNQQPGYPIPPPGHPQPQQQQLQHQQPSPSQSQGHQQQVGPIQSPLQPQSQPSPISGQIQGDSQGSENRSRSFRDIIM